MVSMDYAEIVGHLKRRPCPMQVARSRSANTESAGDGQGHEVAWIVPDVDTQVGRGEERGRLLQVRGPIPCRPKRIDLVETDQVRIPENERIHLQVGTPRRCT